MRGVEKDREKQQGPRIACDTPGKIICKSARGLEIGSGANRAHPISSAAGETGSSLTGGSRRACDGQRGGPLWLWKDSLWVARVPGCPFLFRRMVRGVCLYQVIQHWAAPLQPPAGHVLTCAWLPIHSSHILPLSPIPSQRITSIVSSPPAARAQTLSPRRDRVAAVGFYFLFLRL